MFLTVTADSFCDMSSLLASIVTDNSQRIYYSIIVVRVFSNLIMIEFIFSFLYFTYLFFCNQNPAHYLNRLKTEMLFFAKIKYIMSFL